MDSGAIYEIDIKFSKFNKIINIQQQNNNKYSTKKNKYSKKLKNEYNK